jgi:hypothetical protein
MSVTGLPPSWDLNAGVLITAPLISVCRSKSVHADDIDYQASGFKIYCSAQSTLLSGFQRSMAAIPYTMRVIHLYGSWVLLMGIKFCTAYTRKPNLYTDLVNSLKPKHR